MIMLTIFNHIFIIYLFLIVTLVRLVQGRLQIIELVRRFSVDCSYESRNLITLKLSEDNTLIYKFPENLLNLCETITYLK